MTKVAKEHASLLELSLVLVPRARVEGIRLARSMIRSATNQVAGPKQVEYSFNATTNVVRDAKSIEVHAFLIACAKNTADSDSMGELLRIEAEFILNYVVEPYDEITDEQADAFGKMTGIYNVWPYWREYVQSTTVRLGLPPLVLPLVTGDFLLQYYSSKAPAHTGAEAGVTMN
jgi:hypothetical protein